MRERLIELLDMDFGYVDEMPAEKLADYLLANGVIVPPVKVGQTVWMVHEVSDVEGRVYFEKREGEVYSVSKDIRNTWTYIRYDGGLYYWHPFDDFGKAVFLTKEEAERALAERSKS